MDVTEIDACIVGLYQFCFLVKLELTW